MKKNFENSDQKMRETLSDFRIAAPEGAWENISNQLPTSGKQRRKGFYLWFVLASLFLLVGTGYFFFPEQASDQLNRPQSENHSNQSISNNSKNQYQSNSDSKKSQTRHQGSNSEGQKNSIASNSVKSKDEIRESKSKASNTENVQKAHVVTGSIPTQKKKSETQSKNPTGHTENEITSEKQRIESERLAAEQELDQKSELAKEEAATLKNKPDLDYLEPLEISLLNQPPSEATLDTTKQDENKPKLGVWSAEFGLGAGTFGFNPQASAPLSDYLKQSEKSHQNAQIFANIHWNFTPNWSLSAGLAAQKNQYQLNYDVSQTSTVLVWDTIGYYIDTATQIAYPILDSSYVTSTTTNAYSSSNDFTLISIPFGVAYSLPLGTKSSLGLSAGGVLGFRVGGKGSVLTDQQGTTIPLQDAWTNKALFSARFGIRYAYFINKQNQLFIEPWMTLGLSNFSSPALPYRSKFNNTGVQIGYRIYF